MPIRRKVITLERPIPGRLPAAREARFIAYPAFATSAPISAFVIALPLKFQAPSTA
jgi:hypothetical protein